MRMARALICRCRSSVGRRDHRPCTPSDPRWSRGLHEAQPSIRLQQKPVNPELRELQIKTLACTDARTNPDIRQKHCLIILSLIGVAHIPLRKRVPSMQGPACQRPGHQTSETPQPPLVLRSCTRAMGITTTASLSEDRFLLAISTNHNRGGGTYHEGEGPREQDACYNRSADARPPRHCAAASMHSCGAA